MIRFANEKDIPRMLEIYAPNILESTASFEYTVPTAAEFTRRFHGIASQFPWLVYEEAGVVMGYAYGSYHFTRAAYLWSAETTIYLAPQVRGRGVGRRLYEVLEQLLTCQGYRMLYAIVTEENSPSVAFHEAVGFERIALLPALGIKHGKELGIYWLQKCLKSGEMPSDFPLPVGDIVSFDRNWS